MPDVATTRSHGGRTGRPPLTEHRRAEIRLEIARAAVHLFVGQGVAATTGEQIGAAAGVSARTVWRYFPNKESCVRPLLTAGIEAIASCLRDWPPGRPLDEALDRAFAAGTTLLAAPDGAPAWALVRLTRTEPGLRAVWLQARDDAEPAFARALAARAGLPADDLRPMTQAALLNAALRTAVEYHAWHTPVEETDTATAQAELAATLRSALAITARGFD
ncbi:TetR/AcrR family transcriptional regulator [Marinactinospora rubrisoli]|uniref:TetR/AcrR family transcriptional regulator n=1 Tax=Marinactinospora rubrisoli TaxID=2715399 RepID=A0ABW2KMR4_9ACTN